MNFLAVLADEFILCCAVEFGRNSLSLLVVGDTVRIGALNVVKVVDCRRHKEPELLYNMLILYDIDGAAWSKSSKALKILYAELPMAWAENYTFHPVRFLSGGSNPFTTLSVNAKMDVYLLWKCSS